ncbi:MAG: hypothetical protein D3908_15795, partial [Candidatus Electrothrix sp. AUS4]|nr:hypothetical protein [Candidatus Electrothrix sp. AUS4]
MIVFIDKQVDFRFFYCREKIIQFTCGTALLFYDSDCVRTVAVTPEKLFQGCFHPTIKTLFNLLRPRRFGKTLFVSTLRYYYDILFKDEFDTLFGKLA